MMTLLAVEDQGTRGREGETDLHLLPTGCRVLPGLCRCL